MECTISSESQKQGGSRNGNRAVVHATQRDEKAGLAPVDFQTAGRNFGRRRREVVKQVCMKNLDFGVREHSPSAATTSQIASAQGVCDPF